MFTVPGWVLFCPASLIVTSWIRRWDNCLNAEAAEITVNGLALPCLSLSHTLLCSSDCFHPLLVSPVLPAVLNGLCIGFIALLVTCGHFKIVVYKPQHVLFVLSFCHLWLPLCITSMSFFKKEQSNWLNFVKVLPKDYWIQWMVIEHSVQCCFSFSFLHN